MRGTGTDRGGVGRKLLITLLVIVVVLIALDRIGDAVAERYAADTIQKSQQLPHRPSVDITGFPFLTQLASGNFDQIVVSDNEVPVGSGAVHFDLSTIQVRLHRVHVARTLTSVHAAVADAVATMSYQDLGRALGGATVRYAGDGRVRATKTITILGHHVSGSISAAPALLNGALAFTKDRVNNIAAVVAAALPAIRKIFTVRLPLDGIPFDVRVRRLSVDTSGLHLALVGHNLSYSR